MAGETINPKLQKYFSEYAADHTHPTNQLTHKFAIPLIMFHIIAMLDWVSLSSAKFIPGLDLTLGLLFLLGALAFYFTLHKKLTAMMAIIGFTMLFIGKITPIWVVVSISILAWIVQFSGHYIWEKKSPSFFTNIVQLFIGPLFFLAYMTGEYKPSRTQIDNSESNPR